MGWTEQEEQGHLTEEARERLLAGSLGGAQIRRLFRHLARGCKHCRDVLVAKPPVERYDFPFAKAVAAAKVVARDFAEARRRARQKLDRILAESGEGAIPVARLRLSRAGTPAVRWAWCEALIEAAAERRGADPTETLKIAEQAVELADKLAREPFPRRAVADLQGHARMEYANLLRVHEDLGGAFREIEVAARKLARTSDPRLTARLQDLCGSLFRAKRMFPEAMRVLASAERYYRDLGDTRRAARVLVNQAAALMGAGRPEEAIKPLEQAMAWIDREGEPTLRLAVEHNLLLALSESGRAEEARRRIWSVRALCGEFGTALEQVKLLALEATIAVGLGEPQRAERLFREAKAGYEGNGFRYLAAIAALDLAAVLLEQNRSLEVPSLIEQALATFRRLGIEREALAAVVLLYETARRGAATAALVRDVLKKLPRDEVRESRDSS